MNAILRRRSRSSLLPPHSSIVCIGNNNCIIMQVPATSRVSMGVSSMVLHKGVELVGMCVLPATLPTPQDVLSESETGVLAALLLPATWVSSPDSS